MRRWYLPESAGDRIIARWVAREATPVVEGGSKVLTLVGDEHLTLAVAAVAWAALAFAGERKERQAEHFGLTMIVAAVVPHLIKAVVAQTRPDRVMVHGDRQGIPKSGQPRDAFPSGHAVHLAAMAAVASRFRPDAAAAAWALAVGAASTRIMLLAHWASDVVAGFGLGWAIEKVCWRWRRSGRFRPDPAR
jgi:membrane-associated phospholipid phosphatase